MSPTLTSSLLTLLCASASLVAASEPLTIPLEKRNLVPLATEAGVVIKDNLLQTLEFTKQKYHATLVNYQINHDGTPYPGTPKLELSRGPGKKGNGKRDGSVPLRPLSGSALWAGDIQVGGQTFRIDFDTGSSDLWIPSVNCTSPACQCTGTNCDRKNKFDCTKSKTCIPYPDKNFTLSYVDGSGVRGKQYNDTGGFRVCLSLRCQRVAAESIRLQSLLGASLEATRPSLPSTPWTRPSTKTQS